MIGGRIIAMILALGFLLFAIAAIVLSAGSPPAQAPVQVPTCSTSYTNVPYVLGTTNTKQMLDIYIPRSVKPTGGYPLLIFVHGGGFAVGDKFSAADDFMAAMKGLDNGFVVASVNYRLSDEAKAPAQIVDVKAAVRYLKVNASKYGINVDKVVLMGFSAGASIASAVATSSDSTAFDAELTALGVSRTPDRVAAVISLFGLFNFNTLEPQFKWLTNPADTSLDSKYLPTYANDRKFFAGMTPPLHNDPNAFEYRVLGGAFETKQDIIKMVNAETYIGTNEPPFFIRHGNNDDTIPFLQSVDFACALEARGNRVDFALVPGAQHGLPGMNFFQKFNAQDMYDWLKGILMCTVPNVTYVPGSTNPLHKLDLYTPDISKPAGGYPLLVYVHGGGFRGGDKATAGDSLGAALSGLDKGYMVAAVNYRLAGTDKAPAQVVDVKAAIRYLRANAAKYGYDPDRIALYGVSAGASIAATVAVTGDSNLFDAELNMLGAVKATDKIAAAVLFYGLYNFYTVEAQKKWLANSADTSLDSKFLLEYGKYRPFFSGKKESDGGGAFLVGGSLDTRQDIVSKISAQLVAGKNEPPIFLRHGTIDDVLPFLQSVEFANTLKANGNKVDFKLVEGAEHGLPGNNFFRVFKLEEMYDWLSANL